LNLDDQPQDEIDLATLELELESPLVGVYLLMLNWKVVYIGSSLNIPSRIKEHRTNGRPFDQAFYIATSAEQRETLEKI
jgi:hypothetical protein